MSGWVSVCLLSLVFSSQAERRLYLDHSHDTAHFKHQTSSRGKSQLQGHVILYLTMDFSLKIK